jgi:RNA polymerase sigma factor (TIGR02999 family)
VFSLKNASRPPERTRPAAAPVLLLVPRRGPVSFPRTREIGRADMNDTTRILNAIGEGDRKAAEELLPLVYEELRKLAAQRLASEAPGQTLQATALVHEAYIRLVDTEKVQHWNSRGHFFAAAAEAMRRILVESARHKGRVRHGGQMNRVEFDNFPIAVNASAEDLLDVHEALDGLLDVDAQAAELVKLHYFLGLSMDESAQLLGISPRTAYRTWSFARAWLYQKLGRDSS